MHVFVAGRIVEEGGPELADQLEAEGYDKYVKAARLTAMTSDVTDETSVARDCSTSRA